MMKSNKILFLFFFRRKSVKEHEKLHFDIGCLLAYPPRIGGKPYAFGVWHGELLIIVAGVQPIISTPFIHIQIIIIIIMEH